jgi:large subunit ribosomal protein L22
MPLKVVKASLKSLQMTPRKVGEVVALVRGRNVEDALVILAHTPRRAAKPVAKLIESARANATNNHGLKAEGLKIETVAVTSGPRLKRYRPVSRGMAHPFQKRSSHIYLTLTGLVKPAQKPAKTATTAKSASAKTGTNSKREEK